MFRGRGRSRGIPSAFPRPSISTEEARITDETATGPPPLFPEFKNLPVIPEIDRYGDELLVRWHKYRHVCRSGPYFLEDPYTQRASTVDHFAVKKFSDKEVAQKKRPSLTSIMSLSPIYFPEELSSKRQRKESSSRALTGKALESLWADQTQLEKEFGKLDEIAKKNEAEKKEETDGDAENAVDDKDEDDYSQDDYRQGEYFDDDEEYDDFEDASDEGPVY